jgi:DNA-binding MarR family transcriptional regulator
MIGIAYESSSPYAGAMGSAAGGGAGLAFIRLGNLTRARLAERFQTDAWLVDSGMRPACFGILRVIGAWEPVSQREVSEAVQVHPSEMVDLIDLLEGKGWVERARDDTDRRRYHLHLTGEGRRALARLNRMAEEVEDEILAPLSPAARERLGSLLGELMATHLPPPQRS